MNELSHAEALLRRIRRKTAISLIAED